MFSNKFLNKEKTDLFQNKMEEKINQVRKTESKKKKSIRKIYVKPLDVLEKFE